MCAYTCNIKYTEIIYTYHKCYGKVILNRLSFFIILSDLYLSDI